MAMSVYRSIDHIGAMGKLIKNMGHFRADNKRNRFVYNMQTYKY